MKLIGHRGCAAQYPENTVSAVTAAAEQLDTIEVDVRRCGSGELVVIHDPAVDRVSDGSGRVADLTLVELEALDVLGTGEGVPTLEAVLDVLDDDVTVQIELKEEGIAVDALDAVRVVDNEVIVSSFLPEALEAVAALGSTVPTGLLFDHDPDGNLERALELRCMYVHPHYDLCLDTDVVDRAHRQGFGVIAWKAAKTSEEVDALRNIGVDGVTADRWDIV